ncbi:MAG TPA: TonB-dependent receptor plug domain-containing protein, partial [Ideonella sp.]|nr:TonB-dependent receptor plug domain-containing protein [Ideonella sp.]
ATKTDTALTETPQSISVISAGDIASRGAISLQEALRYSAGLRTEPNGADYRFVDYVTARGGFEAADYLDGMRRPTSFSSATTSARS